MVDSTALGARPSMRSRQRQAPVAGQPASDAMAGTGAARARRRRTSQARSSSRPVTARAAAARSR